MSLEKLIEEQISKAMAEGEFEDLPGEGRPLDLRAYFETPEHLRLCYSMLKNADFVPPEVELLREIERLRLSREAASDERQRKQLDKEIAEKTLTFKLLLENSRRAK